MDKNNVLLVHCPTQGVVPRVHDEEALILPQDVLHIPTHLDPRRHLKIRAEELNWFTGLIVKTLIHLITCNYDQLYRLQKDRPILQVITSEREK
jgi:hypothetical protein